MRFKLQKRKVDERRKYIRLNSVFPVQIFISGKGDDKDKRFVQGFTRDVSLGGLCLTVNNPDENFLSLIKTKQDTFDITIDMPISRKPVDAQVRIAWRGTLEGIRHKQLRIGVEYQRIARQDKIRIIHAARRMIWLPRIATLAIVILICALGVNYSHTIMLRKSNEELIRRFYQMQERGNAYELNTLKVNEEFELLKEEISRSEGVIVRLKEQLESVESPDFETLLLEKGRMEEELNVVLRDKKTLENELEKILEKRKEATRLLEEVQIERRRLDEATVKNMYQWLRTHQNRLSGLIMSFEGDRSIKNWAFTYDQSLACQVFLISGDFERAKKILSFFKNRARKENGGYYNAYSSITGKPTERVVNVGPNVWIGIAAIRYTEDTGDKTYLDMAEDIARWAISLKDKEGGIKGGPQFSWYSTEHNLDAYALFAMLYEVTGKEIYKREKESTIKWIRGNTYSETARTMQRGKGDATIATDTFAWAIAAIGPALLFKEGMDPDAIVEFVEENCRVSTDFERPDGSVVGLTGFDFGKLKNRGRGGVVSSEWTAQMVMAFRIMADFYITLGDEEKAKTFNQKVKFYLNELDKMVISSPSKSGQGAGCLPYATQPNAETGHGWRTPKGKQTGSVAGTAYTIFAKKDYNPLSLD